MMRADVIAILELETLYDAGDCRVGCHLLDPLAGAVRLAGSALAVRTLTSCASQTSCPAFEGGRPNVLMVFVDEMRFPLRGAMLRRFAYRVAGIGSRDRHALRVYSRISLWDSASKLDTQSLAFAKGG